MNAKLVQTLIGGVVAVILVVTLSLISYRVIDASCVLGEKMTDPGASHEILKTQMQDLKDWGGLVLGFFFGAGFNFVSMMVVSKFVNKKDVKESEVSPPEKPSQESGEQASPVVAEHSD